MGKEMLTARQRRLLCYIVDYCEAHDGEAPTQKQMMEHLGPRSSSGLASSLGALERAGWIVRERGVARGISLATPMSWQEISRKLTWALVRLALRAEVVLDGIARWLRVKE